eukprot:GFUD01020909.1.p1 GENE.GFUD01020909.1~~GFUD01020909.1.p1  ORF type:complete len:173 (-),score=38.08 GFUD01020909.1:511-1029(-)
MLLSSTLIIALVVQVSSLTSQQRTYDEASWSKAVSNYFSTASLPSLALGLIDPNLPKLISSPQTPSADEKNVALNDEADWVVAIRKVLARQSTYNTVISEILKGITRIAGWLMLTLGIYGNIFTDFERKRRSGTVRRSVDHTDINMESTGNIINTDSMVRVINSLENRKNIF